MTDYTPRQIISALDHLMNTNIDEGMIYDVAGLSNLSPFMIDEMMEQAKSFGWSA
jgi:hypothetical protein